MNIFVLHGNMFYVSDLYYIVYCDLLYLNLRVLEI